MPRLSKIGAAALGAFGWTSGTGATAVTASYLVVAGGGGAGGDDSRGGGGGAGGYLTGTTTLAVGTSYTITIGAGGAGGVSGGGAGGTARGTTGSNTTAFTVTANGGGGAGEGGYPPYYDGQSGGSGGGGGGVGSNVYSGGTGGSATSGQGNIGGNGCNAGSVGSSNGAGAGGGGAGAAGANSSIATPTNGGVGLSNSISGTATYYAGGGAGGAYNGSGMTTATGGLGGGGNSVSGVGGAGGANLGGGGGAGLTTGGAGGSGVVIISYAGAQQFGGGVVTSSGGNTIHTFLTSGTLAPINSLSASYLIVAGGGGGGGDNSHESSGGGAGGLLSGSGITIDTNSTYLVTVGGGGSGGTTAGGTNGGNSAFSMVTTTAVGGGKGGCNGFDSSTGGSGGGGYEGSLTGKAGTSGQGSAGGNGRIGSGGGGSNDPYNTGGGGGAGGVGANATTSTSGAGGVGIASSISGTSTYYAGGGGGGTDYFRSSSSTGGAGGNGGGGRGAGASVASVAGTDGTGGGGGGASNQASYKTGSNGGSGIVIISYAGATQLMAGGTVTISGGNVIHTFTSSGYLTPLTLVGNSLRFRSSASASLTRTYSTPTNSKIWSFSVWIKRGKLGANQEILNNNSSNAQFYFTSSDTLYFYDATSGADYNTTQVFRDPAAWYHIVVSCDTTQSTSSNRLKIYVNGTQVTAFGTSTSPTQNNNSAYNVASTLFALGVYNPTPSNYFDGYMANINFIDGQALTPNSFGTFNSYGVWQPITYGGSYGTNGFYLPFSNTTSTTTLGYDFSPAGNNWTTNNISLTAGATYDAMTDVPTLTSTTAANYAILNPLEALGASPTGGNLNLTSTSGVYAQTRSSIYFDVATTTGFYAEFTMNGSLQDDAVIGIMDNSVLSTGTLNAGSYNLVARGSGGGFTWWTANAGGYVSNTSVAEAAGQVIGVAVKNGKLYFAINNTWVLSGNPTAETNPAFTGLTGQMAFLIKLWQNNATSANFGQRPFAYTSPTGYVGLNTYNL